jgi:hypothetical protein
VHDTAQQSMRAMLVAADAEGMTALLHAVWGGCHSDALRVLLNNPSADPAVSDGAN